MFPNSVKKASQKAEEEISRAKKDAKLLRDQYLALKQELQARKKITVAAEERSRRLGEETVKIHFEMSKVQQDLESW